MARLINTANVEGNDSGLDDYSVIPAGDYIVMIIDSEFRETKTQTGQYLRLKHKVISGEFKGRILWNNLNLDNPNPVAVEIANKTLNTICKACGKIGVEDSEELHGIPMIAKVTVDKATSVNPESNRIKFYDEYTGGPDDSLDMTMPTEGQEQGQASVNRPQGGLIKPGKPSKPGKSNKLPWE